MNKLCVYIYTLLIVISSALAYTGQTPTNISIWITNTSISIYNTKLGNQTISINYSNLTEIQQNYSWNVDYQYDFSGQNVTIITYNYSSSGYNCNYSTYFEEIKLRLKESGFNCSGIYDTAENYKAKYFDCFANVTVCNVYRTINEDYKSQRDNYESIKNECYAENTQLKLDYSNLNYTYSSCITDRDNYSSQRILVGFIFTAVGILIGYIILKVLPDRKKTSGAFSYGKHSSTEIEAINPMEYKPKEKPSEAINPYQFTPTPNQPQEERKA